MTPNRAIVRLAFWDARGDGSGGRHRHGFLGLLLLSFAAILLSGARAGVVPPVAPPEVAAGNMHGLRIRADGSIEAWGSNDYGQIGDTTLVDKFSPVTVLQSAGVTFTGAKSVWAGTRTSYAINGQNGSLWGWGFNGNGNLADNTVTTPRKVPVAMKFRNAAGTLEQLTGVRMVAGNNNVTIACTYEGKVYICGRNSFGLLGNNAALTAVRDLLAYLDVGDDGIIAVAAGEKTCYALAQSGKVYAWGANESGQVGTGAVSTQVKIPTLVTGLPADVVKISAGANHCLAMTRNGKVYTWGSNADSALGLGLGAPTYKTTAVEIPALANVVVTSIAAGWGKSAFLDDTGSIWVCGNQAEGQLGNGATSGIVYAPTVMPNQPCPFTGIASPSGAGTTVSFGYAWNAGHGLFVWGNNHIGQLGMGTTTDLTTPTLRANTGASRFRIVEGQNQFSSADGSLPAALKVQAIDITEQPIAGLSVTFSIAMGGGTISATQGGGGSPTSITVTTGPDGVASAYWALPVPARMVHSVKVTALSLGPVYFRAEGYSDRSYAGSRHSFATRNDGASYSWGANEYGQLASGEKLLQNSSYVSLLAPVEIDTTYSSTAFERIALGNDVSFLTAHETVVVGSDGAGNVYIQTIPGLLTTAGSNAYGLGAQFFRIGLLPNGKMARDAFSVERTPITPWPLFAQDPGDFYKLATEVESPKMVDFALGSVHAAGVGIDGGVWTWGGNASSATLGLNTSAWELDTEPSLLGDGVNDTPRKVPGLRDAIAVAAGSLHTVVLCDDGTVATFGNTGLSVGLAYHAVAVPGLTNVVAVAAGNNFSLALRENGEVWYWGSLPGGGGGTIPAKLSTPPGVIGISARGSSIMVLTSSGEIHVRGTYDPNLPQVVPFTKLTVPGGPVSWIATSGSHSIAVNSYNGETLWWAWGKNDRGQLGNHTLTDSFLPPSQWRASLAAMPFYNDTDGDGLPNAEESLVVGSNPNLRDSNGDGLDDGTSLALGYNPISNDSDNDGLSNEVEMLRGTNPFWNDTDGDGVLDSVDAFPFDPTRSSPGSGQPGDATGPVITLLGPSGVVEL